MFKIANRGCAAAVAAGTVAVSHTPTIISTGTILTFVLYGINKTDNLGTEIRTEIRDLYRHQDTKIHTIALNNKLIESMEKVESIESIKDKKN